MILAVSSMRLHMRSLACLMWGCLLSPTLSNVYGIRLSLDHTDTPLGFPALFLADLQGTRFIETLPRYCAR